MPWTHCERELRDDEACPACGLEKTQWTVEWNVTRTLQVTRKARPAALRLRLLDGEGQPVPDEPYAVELPDGEVVEGRVDVFGQAKVEAAASGACRVSFPDRLPADFLSPEPPAGSDPARPPAFACAAGEEREFRLLPCDWLLSARFLDTRGLVPFAGRAFQVGSRTGTTDAQGVGVLDRCPCRELRVRFAEGEVDVPAVPAAEVRHEVILRFFVSEEAPPAPSAPDPPDESPFDGWSFLAGGAEVAGDEFEEVDPFWDMVEPQVDREDDADPDAADAEAAPAEVVERFDLLLGQLDDLEEEPS